ncbi:ATP-binding protein [Cupriavidus campinensis]|uniref:ATP-binding protein n=1 Tax=Cupriavidus campinensis TaxID=151783 RepID=UPI0024E25533|nr:ATP-binding protein [Cupriavidus campinensis]
MFNDTTQRLAAITDAAQFERIATSVLRSANPTLYANLSHQGVNTEGKTVKAPLDNIGWTSADGDSMCVAAAHTTSSRDDLDGKWLHDPSTVTPRKPGGKPTQPAGDLVKAIGEIAKLREHSPDLRATLALTCNREEPTDVRLKAELLATAANVTLDIWSVSRIAQYLDTTPAGQSIRFAYLGKKINLLSKEELLRVGALSLAARNFPAEDGTLVARGESFGATGHVFLSGHSGMGKTTVCIGLLRHALAEGQPGIVLSDQTVRDATSVEEAIDIELRRYLPDLEQFAGSKALGLCSELSPLVVVVEDINRGENTTVLLNKLVGWTLPGTPQGSIRSNWRLLCPVWPRFLAGIEKSKEITNAGIVHTVGLYSEDAAREAVKRRGEALGFPQNDLSATAIAQALGRDPLLIGLHDFVDPTPEQDIIAQYVTREFDRIALAAGLTNTDLETAVDALMSEMLSQRRLSPTWRDAQRWLANSGDLSALRVVVAAGTVLRLTKGSGIETIEARHDRVLHSLLAHFIARSIKDGIRQNYLSDPYYADFVGAGVAIAELEKLELSDLLESSPLIAFYAFKYSIHSGRKYATLAATAIEDWVSLDSSRERTFDGRRARGLQILSEVDSPLIKRITDKFPKTDWHQSYFEARFRNGDLGAALNWLTEYSFDTTIGGRRELIEHVRVKYGTGLVRAVEKVLADPTLSQRGRRGALYLAGYIADSTLAKAIRAAWEMTSPSERCLEAFLWASARACGAEAAETLGPVCDAWENLPDPKEDGSKQGITRSSLAAHGIAWKFRDHVPQHAIPYFVRRAQQSDALRWPITYMLRGVDDPNAVQHEIEYVADRRREDELRSAIVDHFLHDEWRRRNEESKPMSEASKQRLLELSMSDNDSFLRKAAFALWEMSVLPSDLAIAQSIDADSPLYDKALWARVRRHDLTVVPELLEKIEENPAFWWQAGRHIWTDDLTNALDAALQRLSQSTVDDEHLGCWIFPELLLRLEISSAERLLLGAWAGLSNSPKFIQTALCLATPKLIELANASIKGSNAPADFFKHFHFTAGLKIEGRDGFTRLAQLDAVRPHLAYLEEWDIYLLWENCNKRNWREFREEFLDPILLACNASESPRISVRGNIDLSALDDELAGTRRWAFRWLQDQQQRGAEHSELITVLLQWMLSKNTVAALAVGCQIYSRHATRKEFAELDEATRDIPDRDLIIAKTRFDVFHRTLV